jgi:zinc protease
MFSRIYLRKWETSKEKIMKKLFATLLLFVTLTLCASAADKGYTVVKFPSGQSVVVKQVSQNPIVTIDTWIKTGSINETAKNAGVAHFLEHLFFKGTEKHPPGAIDRILESKGAHTNAATSKDFTHYYITIPSKDFELALSLHADMLLNPMLPRKELEKERGVVLEEISKNLDSPSRVMYENLFKAIYTPSKHPYKRPVIGFRSVIETIERDEILDFYKRFYTPDNMVTIIVGDVDPDDAVKKVREAFDGNKAAARSAKPVYPRILPLKGQIRVEEKKDVNIGYMTIAYKAPKFGAAPKDSPALDVLATILGESKSSKLNQLLREQKRIVHSVNAGYSEFFDDGIFTISATFAPENLKTVEQEIFKEIEAVKKGAITAADVAKAQNMIETSTYFARESISNISNELGYLVLLSGGTSYYDNYLPNIKRVTREDVIRVANRYLDSRNVAISTVMPEKPEVAADPNIKEVSDTKPAKPKTHSATVLEQNENITKYKLENGAELIIRKNDSNSIIAIHISAKGGAHLEKVPSTGALSADAALEGTKNHSAEALAHLLDEKGIRLKLSSGNDAFTISLQTTKNQLPDALSILNEVVNEPLFAQDGIDKVRNERFAAIKRLKDSPMSLGLDAFRGEAFRGSVYGNNTEIFEKYLPKVTREDILRFYNKTLEPKNLVISVVGDVDAQNMFNEFSEIFTPRGAKKLEIKDFEQDYFRPSKNIAQDVTKRDTQTAWLFLGYKTTGIYSEKDIATLRVINAILGQGMSSRLFKNLRESKSLAYSVGSANLQNALDGVFVAYIGTNPKNIEEAKAGLLQEIETLKTEFVSQKELEEAKDKILGNLLISLETNMDEASLNSWYGATGRNIDFLETFKGEIQNVSASDILSVANKYFSKPHIFTVVKP